ncbi:hypothetical protein HEK616_83000 (plasmid) [Streptomyces nigrescens]|uniref:Uncharacterized protein n=1 Tax=Streptomyces nigrescens TaxID=1920 RepID=A0ABN6RDP2_STRNI|nr:hypothetical protein HEK616_83000 [Streptomyces nigrescens]
MLRCRPGRDQWVKPQDNRPVEEQSIGIDPKLFDQFCCRSAPLTSEQVKGWTTQENRMFVVDLCHHLVSGAGIQSVHDGVGFAAACFEIGEGFFRCVAFLRPGNGKHRRQR